MKRSGKTFLVLLILILVNGSCNKIFKKDLSLTVKEYQSLGMPAIDTIWSYDYLVKAHVAIANARMKNFYSLPRANSKRSGIVFNQFINKNNLSFLNDTSISRRDKALQIQSFWNFISDIGRMYNNEYRIEQYYSRELTDIYTFDLYVREKMFDLAREINNSNEPGDKSMQSGLKAVCFSYERLIYTLLGEQVKSNAYNKKDMDRLSIEIARSLSEYFKWIEPSDRQGIIIQIQNTIEKSPSDYVRNNYRNLMEKIR